MKRFELEHVDASTSARAGWIETGHSRIGTPVFMPVGTLGTVKTMSPWDLEELGSSIILGNAYHLSLRPGVEVVERLGGLHRFMSWSGSILTDSGGFQVFSLGDHVKVDREGVTFRSPLDGSTKRFTPESTVDIQRRLGSDIAMPLDHCIRYGAPEQEVVDATERTIAWAARTREAARRSGVTAFAIVQGETHRQLRIDCARRLVEMDFPGYAVGGLSVGEGPDLMQTVLEWTVPELPADKPRYLMGVGTPVDLVEAVARGVDMFDCVMPTRNARNAQAFTAAGTVNLRAAAQSQRDEPIDPACGCKVCRRFCRGYLRHLLKTKEILGLALTTYHNLHFYLRLMERMRRAIVADRFESFRGEMLSTYTTIDRKDA